MTAAADLVATLEASGVSTVFGFPCEQLEPYYAALADSGIRHVHPRSEASAAMMADAYARVTGRLGVCDGVGGPGAAYTGVGLTEAEGASSPVLALTGDNDRSFRGREAIQDADNAAILDAFVGASHDPESPDRVVEAVRNAARAATVGVPEPTHVNLPEDVLAGETEAGPGEALSLEFATGRPAPAADDVAALADVVTEAERPVVVAGEGALRADAADAVTAFAAETNTPVVTSMNGKGVVAEDEPYAGGVVGRWGYCEVANDLVEDADAILGLGCRFGELSTVGWSLLPDDATLAHVDLDPHWLGRNYDADVAVQADLRATVEALREALLAVDFSERRPRIEQVAADREAWREEYAGRLESDRTPIDPARVVAELQSTMPEDGLLVSATSFPGFFTGAFYEVREPGIGYIQARGSDGINCCLPQALGAQAADPDRAVVAVSGDGGIGYHIADLETAVREDLPVVVVVLNNQSLASSKASQLTNWGVDVSTDFEAGTDYAAVARGFGCAGAVVEDPDAVRPELADALARDRPTLLDVRVDPGAVPPVLMD
ncbi:thiamine pyrophosphate-binding protein [Haloarchaeobius amylolyticus]|uniref:thiamine pyrophosphate-binding protein n=1 Tax=Haloarchaeobius amylolyticus TaxID=1198296 RepID=UPI00226D5EA9|nr:thiamine pyrophosphate-binding protein [Haloarchaeobius amylolyticus]